MKQPEPRYLAVGRVLRPHGVRGELRVEILTDYPERLATLPYLYVGSDYRRYAVKQGRVHHDVLLLELVGCEDRNAAELLRGMWLYVALEDAIPLETDEYYHFQLAGLQVETTTGEALGEIVEVLALPNANDVYIVHGARGEILIPGVREVVKELDLTTGRMVINLLPGLLSPTD